MLAALLRSELAGMFLVIMASFVDVSLQNPIANAAPTAPSCAGCPPTAPCSPRWSPPTPTTSPGPTSASPSCGP
ncbi:hypothetical protein ACFQVA_39140 [Actinomadura keratinilytica]